MVRHFWEKSYPAGIKWDLALPQPVAVESFLEGAAANWPERTAIDFYDRTISILRSVARGASHRAGSAGKTHPRHAYVFTPCRGPCARFRTGSPVGLEDTDVPRIGICRALVVAGHADPRQSRDWVCVRHARSRALRAGCSPEHRQAVHLVFLPSTDRSSRPANPSRRHPS